MRISLFSGPGSGKSTIAAKLFAELKLQDYNIELCQEFVKAWAYEKRKPKSFDACYLFAKQMRSEDLLLQNGVKHLITDSPILMSCAYAKKYVFPCWRELTAIAKEFDKRHPALNFFLDRGEISYQGHGRYESYDEAVAMDRLILDFLDQQEIKYQRVISVVAVEEILNHAIASFD